MKNSNRRIKEQKVLNGLKKMIREQKLNEQGNGYYSTELDKITFDTAYAPLMVIKSGVGGEKTKNLPLTKQSIPIIIKWLNSNLKNAPEYDI